MNCYVLWDFQEQKVSQSVQDTRSTSKLLRFLHDRNSQLEERKKIVHYQKQQQQNHNEARNKPKKKTKTWRSNTL